MHYNFYRRIGDREEQIEENEVYQDFIREWDRKVAVSHIYDLKCGKTVEIIRSKQAIYRAEEDTNESKTI